ncbi:MAG: GIY-YIG nuclease family protein [Bacteroidia bacterium]
MLNIQSNAFVYILTNYSRSTLYVGVSSKLKEKITDHKNGLGSEFCIKYNCDQLVFIKDFDSLIEAIVFEKTLKRWRRNWKEELIESINPKWTDLSYDILAQ